MPLPFAWTLYTAGQVRFGSSPGEPLEDLVGRVSPTPLFLIAAGMGVDGEREANHVYARRQISHHSSGTYQECTTPRPNGRRLQSLSAAFADSSIRRS